MRWFEGTIPAAIALAKQQNSVFVVFIAGDDDQSTQMTKTWEDDSIGEVMVDNFVAIKVDARSETCIQFSQIYPVVCIPSSFFIGDNGIPLEVIAGSISAEELVKRIEKVKQMCTQRVTSAGNFSDSCIQPSVLSPQNDVGSQIQSSFPEPSQQNESIVSAEMTPVATKEALCQPLADTASSNQLEPNEENDDSSDEASADVHSTEDLNVKVERITKKLEERRESRKKEEEKNELKKEVERRQQGKGMLEFKKKQEEEKTKRMLEERNREKAEEKAARERVKQQIALDRADRAARFAQSKAETEAARVAAMQAKQAELDQKKEAAQKEKSLVARIQFRLPDGSSFTNQFPSEAHLEEARRFASQQVGSRYGNFSLAIMFPRREFTKEDYGKTLLELELAPSASIVLLPAGRPTTAVQRSGNSLWAFVGTIFSPVFAMWRFICNFLFANPQPSQAAAEAFPQQEHPQPVSRTTEPNREAVRRRIIEKRGEDFKKEGKVYRLRTPDDSEDDNNTWNGNSTQQM